MEVPELVKRCFPQKARPTNDNFALSMESNSERLLPARCEQQNDVAEQRGTEDPPVSLVRTVGPQVELGGGPHRIHFDGGRVCIKPSNERSPLGLRISAKCVP